MYGISVATYIMFCNCIIIKPNLRFSLSIHHHNPCTTYNLIRTHYDCFQQVTVQLYQLKKKSCPFPMAHTRNINITLDSNIF